MYVAIKNGMKEKITEMILIADKFFLGTKRIINAPITGKKVVRLINPMIISPKLVCDAH